MKEEPTVLDYVKSLLMPWRGKPLPIPPLAEEQAAPGEPGALASLPEAETLRQVENPAVRQAEDSAVRQAAYPAVPQVESLVVPQTTQPAVRAAAAPLKVPWRALVALGLALVAQLSLEPRPNRGWLAGLVIYLLAAGWMIWANWRQEYRLADMPEEETRPENYRVRAVWVYISLPLALVAFLALGGNRFTTLNVTLWAAAILATMWAFWRGELPILRVLKELGRRLLPPWHITVTPFALAMLAVTLVVVFFRLYRLNQVPPEMVSDHAEKLLDVWDVLHGQPGIFFPRNTGREALQMYLTAGVIQWLGTGYTHLSLKIGTALAGLLTLPYIYLLGKELGSRRAGMLAMLLAGIGYWPNVIARVGLRFPLYPLFVAPVLFYLMRGLRTSNRNDFILAGLALGIGLHGYTPIRILPFVVVIVVGIYLLHRHMKGQRLSAVSGLIILAVIALMVFLPLLRFSFEYPELFSYRAFTRLGSVERPLPGPALVIFLKNLWNALAAFGWSDGQIWVNSVTNRPALDVVTAVLFHLGFALVTVRYLRQRHWQDLILLLAVPLLMMPSILSLAFPDENPAMNRAAGALVPVFLLAGLALDGLVGALRKSGEGRAGRALGWGMALLLVGISASQNYDLVFNQYQRAYQLSSWNTSEMGQVVRDFGELYGSSETAWVVAYPYWVDTRLVGMNAGDTTRDYAIAADQLSGTTADPRPKLFILYPEDQNNLEVLRLLYPQGNLTVYPSRVDKNFLIFTVPPSYPPAP